MNKLVISALICLWSICVVAMEKDYPVETVDIDELISKANFDQYPPDEFFAYLSTIQPQKRLEVINELLVALARKMREKVGLPKKIIEGTEKLLGAQSNKEIWREKLRNIRYTAEEEAKEYIGLEKRFLRVLSHIKYLYENKREKLTEDDFEKLFDYIKRGVDPNTQEIASTFPLKSSTALMLAAGAGYSEIVDKLLALGADPDIEDEKKIAPIFLAAKNGHLEIVKKLLNAGVKINKSSPTALEGAVSGKHVKIIQYLLSQKADPNKGVPLMSPASDPAGDLLIVNMLLQSGADPNKQDAYRKMTPLMYAAAEEGNRPIVRMLLDAGADPTIKDVDGNTAIDYTKKEIPWAADIIQMLEDATQKK